MGLQEALQWAQREFPDAMAGRQLWYMDDGSLVGVLSDIAFFLRLLTGEVRDGRGRTFEECTGYRINIGKSSLWGRLSAAFHERELVGMSDGERAARSARSWSARPTRPTVVSISWEPCVRRWRAAASSR